MTTRSHGSVRARAQPRGVCAREFEDGLHKEWNGSRFEGPASGDRREWNGPRGGGRGAGDLLFFFFPFYFSFLF